VTALSALSHVGTVTTAQDGESGLEKARRTRPHIVVLDVRLPGISGLEVLPRLLEVESPPRVVMFTNYPYEQARGRAMDLGASAMLDKASELPLLLDLVGRMAEEAAGGASEGAPPEGPAR